MSSNKRSLRPSICVFALFVVMRADFLGLVALDLGRLLYLTSCHRFRACIPCFKLRWVRKNDQTYRNKMVNAIQTITAVWSEACINWCGPNFLGFCSNRELLDLPFPGLVHRIGRRILREAQPSILQLFWVLNFLIEVLFLKMLSQTRLSLLTSSTNQAVLSMILFHVECDTTAD